MSKVQQNDKDTIRLTADCLRAGGVVVLPTDTVYGLAAIPSLPDAVRMLHTIKGRPERIQLPIMGATLEQVAQLGIDFTRDGKVLAEHYWPGPLTMVFGFDPAAERPSWLSGREEVAIRIPQHPFLLELMAETGVLVVTSANLHGLGTPAWADAVSEVLGSRVSLVVDGGLVEGMASTLVNVRHGRVTIEREGLLTAQDISTTLARAPGTS